MFGSIMEMIKGWFTKDVLKMPNYVVTKLTDGKYDVAVSLPAVGTQHYILSFDENTDEFKLEGKVAIIGPDAVMPIAAFSAIINAAFADWVADSTVRAKLQSRRKELVDRYNSSRT